ncbi:MAG TPA: heme ABC exporter ATP-binding protein CcmA [Acidimicrobiales bacterium]|nr:heme ABC exporter ATP-binding protein CcmA [Acidimicrobiales bacterium]
MTSTDTPAVATLRDAVVVSGGFPLLAGVDLDLYPGSLSVVTGPNGAGKTSLLRLLAGLVALSQGHGRVAGVNLKEGDLRLLRRRVGWLGHEGSFYDDLSVRENLTFAARALARPLDELDAAIERVGLGARADTAARQLSAGQRRRLGLAWLLLRRPELWLLDEPYASLDDEGRSFFDALLGDVIASGATVVVSAHDPLRSEALHPKNLIMAGGRIVREQS